MTTTNGRLGGLPRTSLGWAAVSVGILYGILGLVMARGAFGVELPEWLGWALGLGIGALALGLCIAAYVHKERSFLLVLAVVVTMFWWLQWLILFVIGVLIR